MTEKRFTIEIDDENITHILDNGTDIGQYNLCKLLNALNNENEQLKKSIECQNEMIKEQCMKIDWASECGVKWDKEFKNWRGF